MNAWSIFVSGNELYESQIDCIYVNRSGLRMCFFGAWNYSEDLTADKDFVENAYEWGRVGLWFFNWYGRYQWKWPPISRPLKLMSATKRRH
jgi:hypothetical protein